MRRAAVAALAATALAVTACSSSGGDQRKAGGSSPASSSSSAKAVAKGTPVAPATLAATVGKGLAGVRSLHVALDLGLAGQRTAVTADETLRSGRTQTLRASSADIGGSGPITLVVVGGKTYGKLPKPLNTTGKPWLLISSASKNERVAQLAASLDFALGAVSIDRAAALLRAASSAGRIGTTTLDGVAVTHYSVVVSVSKLPMDFPGRSLIATAGLSEIPANVYLDASGRPVRLAQSLAVGGQPVSVTISLSRYNAPVTISAPPADQVGTA